MSLELLNKRLNYQGGNQQQRMISDKLKGLKKALLYSYQAATAILPDGKEFRCLINSDKNKPVYDNKILSIPYKDICLNTERIGKTSEGEINIQLTTGDVFIWKETNTHWLVYLQYLEEDAYFRSEIRRCDQKIEIDGNEYWVYIRGPVETSIEWNQKAGVEWNNLNYSLVMYITADQITNSYFSRFKSIKIIDPRYDKVKTWQVVGVDPYYGDGILQVFLDEYFENSIADAVMETETNNDNININEPYIDGPTIVKQYSKAYYQIKNVQNGSWFINRNGEEKNLNSSLKIISLQMPSKIGIFTLIYRTQQQDIILNVEIVPM